MIWKTPCSMPIPLNSLVTMTFNPFLQSPLENH
jgi:hypothetical protein